MINKLYRIENNIRVYKGEINIEDVFYSELNLHFFDYLNNDTKIYYLQCESSYDFSLNLDDLIYLNTLGIRCSENLHFVFSENIKYVKYFQKLDLFFLTSLKNIDFLILIPKLDINNKYYYNLVIGVDCNFNLNQFYNWSLKSVNIKNVNELTFLNLNEVFLNQIFDLLNNKFRNSSISNEEFLLYKNCIIKRFNKEGSKFTKKGRRIYKKIIFKHLCFHLYWFNDKVLKLQNTGFYMDWGYKDTVIFKNENNGISLIESYDPSCFLDVIGYSPEHICFMSWELYDDL